MMKRFLFVPNLRNFIHFDVFRKILKFFDNVLMISLRNVSRFQNNCSIETVVCLVDAGRKFQTTTKMRVFDCKVSFSSS